MSEMRTDIVVAGAGPAGLVAALSMAKAGFAVTLAGPAFAGDDRRTTALMQPALRSLEALGLLGELAAHAAPLKAMRIVDGTDRLIRSPLVTFRAEEIGEDHFGLNIPNTRLAAVLNTAAAETAAIDRHETLIEAFDLGEDAARLGLADGNRLAARLVVAADGRSSAAREAAGITTRTRASGQTAIVLNFEHSRDHHFVSTEFHTESGPFTQVPLPGRRSSLVWVVRSGEDADILARSDAELSAMIEERIQSMLGRVNVEPGRQGYPLTSALPDRFAARRVALVGEAAHVFPPIGAQGLNLGIRDVGELVETATRHADDPGAQSALAAYDRKRRPDIVSRTTAVDLLNRSLLSDLLPAQMLRAAGLGMLRRAAPLRTFFMREGLKTGSGLSGLLGLRETGRRADSRH